MRMRQFFSRASKADPPIDSASIEAAELANGGGSHAHALARPAFAGTGTTTKTDKKHIRIRVHIDLPHSSPFTVEVGLNASVDVLKKAIYDVDASRGQHRVFPGLTGQGEQADLAHMRLYHVGPSPSLSFFPDDLKVEIPWEAWYQAKTFSNFYKQRVQLLAHFPSTLIKEDGSGPKSMAAIWHHSLDLSKGDINLLVRVLPFGSGPSLLPISF